MKQQILSHLPGDFPWQVHWFDTIDSTNDRAKAMAESGAPHGTVLIAGQQDKGRGRMGRSFSSPAGCGIYLSVILRPGCQAQQLMHLTCSAGVAMCDAVESVTGQRPGLKWINDLVMNGRKLGGILTELSVAPQTGMVRYAIVGIGLNCKQAPLDFPPEIRDIAISLETATGCCIDNAKMAAAMIAALFRMDQQLLSQQGKILSQYARDCVTIGKEIMVYKGEQSYPGKAVGIDSEGGLLVTFPDGTTQSVNSGEVSVRGMYGYL